MTNQFTRREVLKVMGAVGVAAPAVGLAAPLEAIAGSDAPSGGEYTWYNTSYRKLFFDFHSHSSAVGLASAFDAEAWAGRLQAANAQAVSLYAKCGFGWS